MNDENLTPFKANREETVINARKGGKASGKARREKRDLRERYLILLDKPLKSGKKATDIEKIKNLSKESIQEANLTAGDALPLIMIQKALKGDVKAYEAVRDQIGQRPIEEHRIAVVLDEDKALDEWIKKLKADKDLKDDLKDD